MKCGFCGQATTLTDLRRLVSYAPGVDSDRILGEILRIWVVHAGNSV